MLHLQVHEDHAKYQGDMTAIELPAVTMEFDLSDPMSAEQFRLAAQASALMSVLTKQHQRFKRGSGAATRGALEAALLADLKQASLSWILEPEGSPWDRPHRRVKLTVALAMFDAVSRAGQLKACLCGLHRYLKDESSVVSWDSCTALLAKHLEDNKIDEWMESHAEDMRWASVP